MNILNENISKKIVILTISIIVFLCLSISTTYSLIYNTKKLSNNTYTTGVLDIQYTEGETLDLSNYIPMNDESGVLTDPYIITITNTGTLTYKFNLNILSTMNDISNIIDAKYIRLQVDDNKVVTLSELNNGIIYSNIILESGDSMDISIRMWLDEDTPNTEIGHTYSAKLVATGVAVQKSNNELHSTSVGYQTLVKLGLDKYAKESFESGIFETTNKTDYLYYFKGDIDYNYVLFNNKYYRIILVDSVGNAKMIYEGDKPYDNNKDDSDIKNTIIGEVTFNDLNNLEKYNGYTYLDGTFNEVNSNVKLFLENWYEKNIYNTEFEKEIVDIVYCNDKLVIDESIATSLDDADHNIIYNSYDRILKERESSFSCGLSDSYTVSFEGGNGSLKYPVGLISADELLLIGDGYINNNVAFWTMTSAKFEKGIAYNFSYDNKLGVSQVNSKLGVRPVLTIKTNNLVGEGTKENPFTFKTTGDETNQSENVE